jgi:hypothetical protein
MIKPSAGNCLGLFLGGQTMKARVGEVQSITNNTGAKAGWGFVLFDEQGLPCATFGYLDEVTAKAARAHVDLALIEAKSLYCTRR